MTLDLDILNSPQKEAVTHGEGPLLILAGAGSGKTRVLTYRIAYLIGEKKVHPENILALTFTNKAAEEMKERAHLLVTESPPTWVSTFHSACVRILRREADYLKDYGRDFLIYDTKDKIQIIKDTLKEQNLDEKYFNPNAVANQISKAKNQLIDSKDYEASEDDFYTSKIKEIYQTYQKKLKKQKKILTFYQFVFFITK